MSEGLFGKWVGHTRWGYYIVNQAGKFLSYFRLTLHKGEIMDTSETYIKHIREGLMWMKIEAEYVAYHHYLRERYGWFYKLWGWLS